MSARRWSQPAEATDPSGHPSNGHRCTVRDCSSTASSSEESSSNLRSTAIDLLFGAGVAETEGDEEDEDDDDEVAAFPLRVSGVKRLIGRFFRLPLPRFSPKSPAPLDEEDDDEEEVAANASRALISSGEIHLEAATAEVGKPDEDWAEPVELRSSAGGRA